MSCTRWDSAPRPFLGLGYVYRQATAVVLASLPGVQSSRAVYTNSLIHCSCYCCVRQQPGMPLANIGVTYWHLHLDRYVATELCVERRRGKPTLRGTLIARKAHGGPEATKPPAFRDKVSERATWSNRHQLKRLRNDRNYRAKKAIEAEQNDRVNVLE